MMTSETRARFLAAVADRVAPESVEEVHLFPPMKQGGIESGVAVVATNGTDRRAPTAESTDPSVDRREPSPLAASAETPEPGADGGSRLTVYTATYRLTLKGPERGKWEFTMHADADAPLVTVDAVVRGVQRRSGDVDDPEKLSGNEFREIVEAARAEAAPKPQP